MSTIDQLRKIRIQKLEKLKKLGINPYPSTCRREQAVGKARKMEGKEVAVAGRLVSLRGHGKIIFADLRDESGKIQIAFKADLLKPQTFSLLSFTDIGDFIAVTGKVGKTQSGEVTVFIENFQLITKAIRPLPDKWYGLKDIEERYRQRYVDLLVNPGVREIFEIRTKVVKFLRDYLNKDGFLEIETPILQPIYGGASAKPFTTHHNILDLDLFLRISDELYLKRIIVGGYEKVYEIGKDFRNEGMDREHNPEFTMLEFYWAYADYGKLMKYTEEMLSLLVKEIKGSYKLTFEGIELDFIPPWPRKTYRDMVLEYSGIDIEKADIEKKLSEEIKKKNIKLDTSGVVGYGALLDTLYKTVVRPNLIGPMFLTDRPTEFVTLAKRLPDDPKKTASFQLLVCGKELINAYNELNDPQDQAERWRESEKLGEKGKEEHEVFDYDYIRALEYGMPPTAGWGMGVDRLVSILTDQHTLKDVILFPTMRPREMVKPVEDLEKKNLPSGEQAQINIPTANSSEFTVIDKAVKNRFPGMKVGVALIKGVKIVKTSVELESYRKEILENLQGLTTDQIDAFSTIAAYRKFFKGFGIDWHSRRPSPDALLRRIALGKGLYRVNTLVDAYNLAVLETKIGLGAFDADKISLPVVLRFAKGRETIFLLGGEKATGISEGEIIYSDKKRIITLDLNYRDCDYTKVTLETKNVLLFADGCDGISGEELQLGLVKGIELIMRFCGGAVQYKAIVDPTNIGKSR